VSVSSAASHGDGSGKLPTVNLNTPIVAAGPQAIAPGRVVLLLLQICCWSLLGQALWLLGRRKKG
jgi:hypothetical protein